MTDEEDRPPLFGWPTLPPPIPRHTRLYASTGFWTHPNTLEFFAAAMILTWGLFATSWLTTKTVGLVEEVHITHAEHLPLCPLSWLCILVGGGHLLTDMEALRLRMFWLFLQMMWWSALAGLIVVSVPSSAAIVMYGGMCVVVSICYLRLYLVHGELFEWRTFLAPALWVIRRYWG